jgi:hypothetical protein
MNPNLGPIEDLGLSFNRLRAAAVGLKVAGVAWANEELKVLNTIRNKLAHQIDAEISEEDVAVLRKDADELLRDSVFKDKLVEHGTYPAWIVEVWAMLFGTMLALEQAMERHKNDLEAQRRELDAAGAQLLHELFEAGGPASSVERTSRGGPGVSQGQRHDLFASAGAERPPRPATSATARWLRS